MPKIHECDRCLLYPRNPYLVCAVHPTAPNTNTCLDFRENPDAEPDELWEPEGATYLLQRRIDSATTAAVDTPCNS
ncbi:MAG TPA: hypothetical protein V6D31_09040 [Candidatus Sericytochromatia bacterium]